MTTSAWSRPASRHNWITISLLIKDAHGFIEICSSILSISISAKYNCSNEFFTPYPTPFIGIVSESTLVTHIVSITIDGGRSWVLFVEMGILEFTGCTSCPSLNHAPHRRSNWSSGYVLNSPCKDIQSAEENYQIHQKLGLVFKSILVLKHMTSKW